MTPALFTDENLLCLVVCRMANLSLEHGNCDAFVLRLCRGSAACSGRISATTRPGFASASSATTWSSSAGSIASKPRIYLYFGNLVMPWTKHVRTGRRSACAAPSRRRTKPATSLLRRYSCNHLITNLLAAGDPLAEVAARSRARLDFRAKARFGLVIDIITAQLRLDPDAARPDAGIRLASTMTQFDEAPVRSSIWQTIRIWRWPRAGIGSASCRRASSPATTRRPSTPHRRRETLLWTSPSILEPAEYHFYAALARAALCDSASADERPQHLEAWPPTTGSSRCGRENCPENFENRAALVGAEIARLEGRELDAERLYEQAIRSARAQRLRPQRGARLRARRALLRGAWLRQIAAAYLRNARYCYLRWGADGKVRQLDEMYPHLRRKSRCRVRRARSGRRSSTSTSRP